MDLDQTIFRVDKTDIHNRKICVRIGNYIFPDICLLCGSNSNMTVTPIEFKAVLLLGVVAGGETTTLNIPLCEQCSHNYLQARKRTNWIMTASFVAGFGILSIPAMLQEVSPKTLKAFPPGIFGVGMGLAILLIVLSFFLLLTKNRHFPIKLQHRGWFLRDDEHHLFTFPNDEVMHRFIIANSSPTRRGEVASPDIIEQFGQSIS